MSSEAQRRPPGFFGGEARSDSSATKVSLLRFLHPRYWRVWLFLGWLRIVASLPFKWSLRMHRRLGKWIGARSRRARGTVEENLACCFPELSRRERSELALEYFANMGAMIAEIALAWFRAPDQLFPLFDVRGVENLERGLAGGRGVILCAGHFTPIELCAIGIRAHAPYYALLYNQRRSRLLSEIQRRSRSRFTDNTFEKRNLRGMLRSLSNNAVVWFSADEVHTGKSSALLPFFGELALTNTSVSRLARISGATVVPLHYCRKADDSGYLIQFGAPLENFPSDDELADTRRLVSLLEAQIRECPAQYFWKQQRFRDRRVG